MLSYWFPTPLAAWVPLVLAIGFVLLAVIAVVVTLARRREEPDANRIAAFYGVGLGLAAVTEFMMYLKVAFGWSLATAWAISTGFVTFIVVVAAAIAILAIIVAVLMQFREENTYRETHGYAH
jgi:hypothetical protein